MVAWRNNSTVRRMNKVTLHRVQLLLGWVTVLDGHATSVYNQVN